MALGKSLQGRVQIRAEGAQIERLINEANKRGITLHDLRREGNYTAVFSVKYDDFRAMRPAFRQARCRAKIISKSGAPYMRSRLRNRVMLVVGAVLCLMLVVGFSQMVWSVRLIGVEEEHQQVVEDVLRARGIQVGIGRDSFDADQVAEDIEQQLEGLSFVGVRMRGMALEVELVYGSDPPVIYDRTQPVHIVAEEDGVIEQVVVVEGEALVKRGQTVQKGQILILGIQGGRSVHASGMITARVAVSGQGSAPLYEEIITPTGRWYNRTLFHLMDYVLPVYQAPEYEHYEIAARETELLPYMFIPAGIRRETVHEMNVEKVLRPEGAAEREAEKEALLDALAQLSDNMTVVDKWVEYGKIKESELQANATLQVLREIGREQPY